MKPDVYFVKKLGMGSLNIMAKPVGGQWLEDEIQGIANLGINRITSLLERGEAFELELKDEPLFCQRYAVDFIHFPLVDRNVPENKQAFITLINNLYQDIKEGINTVVHCRGGIGRTGITACALLMLDGMSVDDAFTLISQRRGVQCPDTEQQWNYMANLEIELRP